MVVGRCTGTEVYTQIPSGPPAGSIPDGTIEGQQLVLGKSVLPGQITLSWGASCAEGDDDYAVYQGGLDDIGNHSPKLCSTLGATTATLAPEAGDAYYLIVPNNGIAEGSYGNDSSGSPRPAGADACHPRNPGSCD
jgi:hypothetical protein